MSHATNDDTLVAYNQGVDKYAAAMNLSVDGDIKAWINLSLKDLNHAASILEIGSGTGRDAAYMESLGHTVKRTDASIGFVTLLKSQGHDATLLNVLQDQLGGPHDLIFADAVLLHFTEDELRALLAKIYSSLKNGGRLAFSLKRGHGDETTSQKLDSPRYFHYWEPSEVTNLLKSAGYVTIQVNLNDGWREGKPQWLLYTAYKEEKI